MVDVQTWEPWKVVQCDNNLGPPIWCFHMKYIMSCGCAKIVCPKQNIKKTYKIIVHLNQSSLTNKVTKNLLMVSSNSILPELLNSFNSSSNFISKYVNSIKWEKLFNQPLHHLTNFYSQILFFQDYLTTNGISSN